MRRSTTRRSTAARASRSASRTPDAATGYFATKDYSYRSKQVAGDGWVLVGDAFGFLDPLYSSGVLLALKSGELAADAIVEGLAAGDTRRRSSASGGRCSTRAWTGCGGWCASTTTASASAASSSSYPHLQGHAHRPADRRPVQRPGGQGVGADGVAVRAREDSRPPGGTREPPPGSCLTRPTSWCCRRGAGREAADFDERTGTGVMLSDLIIHDAGRRMTPVPFRGSGGSRLRRHDCWRGRAVPADPALRRDAVAPRRRPCAGRTIAGAAAGNRGCPLARAAGADRGHRRRPAARPAVRATSASRR